MSKPAIVDELPDFSLVLGGPLFQLFRRARLSGDGLEFLRRRALVISCFAWAPILLLSAFEGHALGGAIRIPFLDDIEAHERFLIALPVPLAAELVVHSPWCASSWIPQGEPLNLFHKASHHPKVIPAYS